jgi:hypothetical protein
VEEPHPSDSTAISTITTATTPTAAQLEAFGGLLPQFCFLSCRLVATIPPPPVTRLSLFSVKEEDIASDQLADVSLS